MSNSNGWQTAAERVAALEARLASEHPHVRAAVDALRVRALGQRDAAVHYAPLWWRTTHTTEPSATSHRSTATGSGDDGRAAQSPASRIVVEPEWHPAVRALDERPLRAADASYRRPQLASNSSGGDGVGGGDWLFVPLRLEARTRRAAVLCALQQQADNDSQSNQQQRRDRKSDYRPPTQGPALIACIAHVFRAVLRTTDKAAPGQLDHDTQQTFLFVRDTSVPLPDGVSLSEEDTSQLVQRLLAVPPLPMIGEPGDPQPRALLAPIDNFLFKRRLVHRAEQLEKVFAPNAPPLPQHDLPMQGAQLR